MSFIDNFKLNKEKEDYYFVSDSIDKGVVFKGTNLWILVFAIIIASLGLNVNSTAVIIGAMLISPLMGPIMGIGFGMAINDLVLLRKSISNYLFAAAVGLSTSTLYFLLSPINVAHSEILARTSPNIYDVLIALFGGFAGILATSSKLKGNVIPGVAIATALMPPLCTAGYGLATLQFTFFFGALYLFLINTVFIALATIISTRFLKFPFKQLPKKEDETRANRIVWIITLITFLPSVYFGYDMVQQNKYELKVGQFVENEAVFMNNFLLKTNIDSETKTISLTYGGQIIEEEEIMKLKNRLKNYNLDKSTLEIQQGFAYLNDEKDDEKTNLLSGALSEKEKLIRSLTLKLDSVNSQSKLGGQIHKELKTQYPSIQSFILDNVINHTDSVTQTKWVGIIHSNTKFEDEEKTKVQDWLKVRMQIDDLSLYFQ